MLNFSLIGNYKKLFNFLEDQLTVYLDKIEDFLYDKFDL